jgi:hypothetical protein
VESDENLIQVNNNSEVFSNSMGSDSRSNGSSAGGGTTIKSKMTFRESHMTSPKFASEAISKGDEKLSLMKKFKLPEKGLSKPLTVE